jgi:hypothetical protein
MSIRNKRLQREIIDCPELVAESWDETALLTLRGVRVGVCLNYPFRPPQLFINEKNVKMHLMAQRALAAPHLACYKVVLPCMCCTMLCANDVWAPSMTLVQAVDDVLQWDALLKTLLNFCAIRHLIRVDDVGAHILHFLF